jgi:hypothetical protein
MEATQEIDPSEFVMILELGKRAALALSRRRVVQGSCKIVSRALFATDVTIPMDDVHIKTLIPA